MTRQARERDLPAPVFIHSASVEAAEGFFAKRAPGSRHLADPDGQLFAAFGLTNGSLWQLLGPPVWWRGLVALCKGHFVGKPTGNVRLLSGAFLLADDEIRWQFRARHAGELPDLSTAPR